VEAVADFWNEVARQEDNRRRDSRRSVRAFEPGRLVLEAAVIDLRAVRRLIHRKPYRLDAAKHAVDIAPANISKISRGDK
jgi:hypothetical protein